MQRYDVIVVGAGPAGASAAEAAAEAGMRVMLLEKQRMPRHKTCGGGVPMVVGSLLHDLVPEAFVEADVRRMRHTWRFGEPVAAPISPPGAARQLSLWMVQRSVFDNALAARAANAGADLRDGVTLRGLDLGRGYVTVRAEADGRAFEVAAEHVIGADGANGATARAVGLRRKRALAVALEAEYPHTWGAGHDELQRDVIHLDFGSVEGGYAWVFPKGDHLNVGAGVFHPYSVRAKQQTGEHLRSAVAGYLEALGLPFDPTGMRFHAHPLPIWSGRERLGTTDGRVLLAGDAAGLINPLFGDGILHAVKSGLIAATAIAEGSAPSYTRQIHGEFAANFNAARRLAAFFYSFPRVCYRHAVMRPGSTTIAARLLCGDALFSDVAGRALRRLRRALAGPSE